MKKAFLTIAFLLVAGLGFAQGSIDKKNIPYTTSSDSYAAARCRMDVYAPEGAKDAPVVVWFHGGGLTGGEKYIPQELKNSGLVVMAANYRLMPKVSIGKCIEDAAAAVAWAVENASQYGGDPAKIYVTGHSAGGYLTSMLALDKKYLAPYGIDPDSLAGYVPFSGQAITHFALREQQGYGQLTTTVDEYAPLFHVRNGLPLMLILSGDREYEMNGRYEEQAFFWRMLKLVGNTDVHIYEMQGYNHGNMPHPGFEIMKDYIFRGGPRK